MKNLVFHVYLVFKYGINLYDNEMGTTLFLIVGSVIYLNKKNLIIVDFRRKKNCEITY